MDCIALYDSGNYAYRICRVFEQKGIVFQVISTPCRIAKAGCGYCLLFPEQYLNHVINASAENGFQVKEVYRIEYNQDRKKYIRII